MPSTLSLKKSNKYSMGCCCRCTPDSKTDCVFHKIQPIPWLLLFNKLVHSTIQHRLLSKLYPLSGVLKTTKSFEVLLCFPSITNFSTTDNGHGEELLHAIKIQEPSQNRSFFLCIRKIGGCQQSTTSNNPKEGSQRILRRTNPQLEYQFFQITLIKPVNDPQA